MTETSPRKDSCGEKTTANPALLRKCTVCQAQNNKWHRACTECGTRFSTRSGANRGYGAYELLGASQQSDIFSVCRHKQGIQTRVFVCHDLASDGWVCSCQGQALIDCSNQPGHISPVDDSNSRTGNDEPVDLMGHEEALIDCSNQPGHISAVDHSNSRTGNDEQVDLMGHEEADRLALEVRKDLLSVLGTDSLSSDSADDDFAAGNVDTVEMRSKRGSSLDNPVASVEQRHAADQVSREAFCIHIIVCHRGDPPTRVTPARLSDEMISKVCFRNRAASAELRRQAEQNRLEGRPMAFKLSDFVFVMRCDDLSNSVGCKLGYTHAYFFENQRERKKKPDERPRLRFSCQCTPFLNQRSLCVHKRSELRCLHYYLALSMVMANADTRQKYSQFAIRPAFDPACLDRPHPIALLAKITDAGGGINFQRWVRMISSRLAGLLCPRFGSRNKSFEILGSAHFYAQFQRLLDRSGCQRETVMHRSHPLFHREGKFVEHVWRIESREQLRAAIPDCEGTVFYDISESSRVRATSEVPDHTRDKRRVLRCCVDFDKEPVKVSLLSDFDNDGTGARLANLFTLSFTTRMDLYY